MAGVFQGHLLYFYPMEKQTSSGFEFLRGRWKWPLLILGVIGLAVYFMFDPSTATFFPPCPLRYATGLKCPGCGSQRAIHQLFHGNIAGAFAYNPILVISIPYLLIGVYLDFMGGRIRFPRLRYYLLGGYAPVVWAVVVVLYTIARNVWHFTAA